MVQQTGNGRGGLTTVLGFWARIQSTGSQESPARDRSRSSQSVHNNGDPMSKVVRRRRLVVFAALSAAFALLSATSAQGENDPT